MYTWHAYVGFVYFKIIRYFTDSVVLEFVIWLVVYSVEELCIAVLDYIARPSWVAIHLTKKSAFKTYWYSLWTYFWTIGSDDLNFVFLAYGYHRSAVDFRWYRQCKYTKLVFTCFKLITVPLVEVSKLLLYQGKQFKRKYNQ